MLEMPAQLGNPDLLNDNLDAELNSPALDAIRAASYRGTKRKFRADEIKETAMNRLCNTKGSRWPAILEVTQDVLMLVERATGTVQAANSKYDELLATIGCGNCPWVCKHACPYCGAAAENATPFGTSVRVRQCSNGRRWPASIPAWHYYCSGRRFRGGVVAAQCLDCC